MIEGFDKEIDALLRRTAAGETVLATDNPKSEIRNPKSSHLDADEISAFAENALPETLKQKYTAHFADCDRCRTILSNTISLNSQANSVSASPVAAPNNIETANIPWYRRLLSFPNPAFALGALVVLLGGFLAFSLLQNGNDSQSTEVSQISEDQSKASGPSAETGSDFSASVAMQNTNMTSMNTATSAMPSNSAPINSSNASTLNTSISNTSTIAAVNNAQKPIADSSANDTNSAKKESPLNEAKREPEKVVTEDDAAMRQNSAMAGSVAGNQTVNNKQADQTVADSEMLKVAPAAPSSKTLAKPEEREKAQNNDARSAALQKKARSVDTANRQSGGKTFNRRDGVWYDSAYNNQSTTNVSRGSADYKKLDSNLRSTADNLGGTVVVVWKGKAYRIQ